MIRGVM